MKKAQYCGKLLFPLLILLTQYSAVTLPEQFFVTTIPHDPHWNADAKQANRNINHFIEPADDIHYDDYHYVGAHNAHVYPRFFSIVRQQDQSILGQLNYGVRGLMLDTYNWRLKWPSSLIGPANAQVCLSHPAPGLLALTQKGNMTYQSLKYEIRRIIEFMKINTKAIITIILEDYADAQRTTQEIKEVTIEAAYDPLFTPADLLDNQWPTLGWMRNNNKRLIIFSQRAANTNSTFHQFSYMTENQYSTTNETALCENRTESPTTAPLAAFNNFSGIQLTLPLFITKKQIEYTNAKRITTTCKEKCLTKQKLFNGYWANRIIDSCDILYKNKQKTIFEYVNELNTIIEK